MLNYFSRFVVVVLLLVVFLGLGGSEPVVDAFPDAFPVTRSFTPSDTDVIAGGWMNPHRFPEIEEFRTNCEYLAGEVGYEECKYDLCRLEHQLVGERWESACGSIDFRDSEDIVSWRKDFRSVEERRVVR